VGRLVSVPVVALVAVLERGQVVRVLAVVLAPGLGLVWVAVLGELAWAHRQQASPELPLQPELTRKFSSSSFTS